MSSELSRKIKNRTKANDVFITPLELAQNHINLIEYNPNDLWLDPCRNNGNYFNQFPNENKDWCEILNNKDFFEYEGKPDIIIQNPPYSLMDKWIQKNISLNPRIISFIIGLGNLTTRRIEILEKAGYGITKFKMLKVYEWYGMSVIVIFEKNKKSIIEIDRKVYR